MAEWAAPVPAVELTPDDCKSFPSRVREKINAAEGPEGSREQWLLVGVGSRRRKVVVRQVLETVGRIAEQRREAMTERHIETLVDLYLDGEERADVDHEIERDNAELRKRYLLETKAWTAADIHEHMHGGQLANPSEPASRWRREKKVFAVRGGRARLFPSFQFADGRPRPIIAEVLKRLPDDMTPWQIAFWFRGGNGWLDGRSPEEALDDRDGVLEAAERLHETAIG